MPMGLFIIKTLISAAIIAMVSEIAKRSPGFAALIASLPLVSILAMLWMYQEGSDVERIASHAETTFWLVLPSLPMFLLLPVMLRHGFGFFLALGLNCLMTALLYAAMLKIGGTMGLKI